MFSSIGVDRSQAWLRARREIQCEYVGERRVWTADSYASIAVVLLVAGIVGINSGIIDIVVALGSAKQASVCNLNYCPLAGVELPPWASWRGRDCVRASIYCHSAGLSHIVECSPAYSRVEIG